VPGSSVGGNIIINGTTIAITAGWTAAQVRTAIQAQVGTTNVGATLNGSGNLVLTGTDAATNITIGSGSTLALLRALGLPAGTTNATNIITQSAAAAGQTLTIKVGSNPTTTITFGAGNVVTLADLNAALAGVAGGIASADPATGDITVTSTSPT